MSQEKHCAAAVFIIDVVKHEFCGGILLLDILQDIAKQRREQFRSEQIQVAHEDTVGRCGNS